MNSSPRSVVVAVSGDSRRAELLDALLGDSNDYDIFCVESIAHGYSRIKQLRPDLIVLFMTIDDVAACELLSALTIDRDVSGIPLVQFITQQEKHALGDIIAEVNRYSSSEFTAAQMN